MTLVLLEGFDDGFYADRNETADGAVSSSYGYTGNGMQVGTTSGKMLRLQPSQITTGYYYITVGAHVYLTAGGWIMGQWDTLTSYADWWISTDTTNNRFVVTDKSGALYSASNTFFINTWYHIEFKVGHSQSAGTVELRVDGVSEISATGRDTIRNSDNTLRTYIYFGGSDSPAEMHIDNVTMLDTTGSVNTSFLGPTEIYTLFPSGNGTTSDMTGSDGNSTDNYQLVDENPVSTADYVESSVEGDKDTYAMDDLTGTPTVNGMITTLYAEKDNVDAKLIRPVVRSGTTDYTGDSFPLSNGSWSFTEYTFEEDPDTATQWTYSGINSMEVGQEVRDS